MSCEGCLTTKRGLDEALEKAKTNAKKYAEENNKSVAIWQEGYEWKYGDASIAIADGKPIRGVLSQYR